MWWAAAIALVAAAAMAAVVLAAGSGTASPAARSIAVAGSTALALLVSGALAGITGALAVPIALSIATGTLPVAAALAVAAASVGTAGGSSAAIRRWIGVLGAVLLGGVLVPVAIVAPAVFSAGCPPTVCPVVDFAGALPFVVGAGAFAIVPAVIVRGTDTRSTTHRRPTPPITAALVLACAIAFLVWLAALEGDVDEYTPRILIAGAIAPVIGAVAWLLVDRVRGIASSTTRALFRGALVGEASILGCLVAVPLPAIAIVAAVCGIAGALLHDAKGLTRSTPGVRAGLTALLVGALGLLAPGVAAIAASARIDVAGYQLGATFAVAVLAITLSIPLAALLRRASRN